MAGSINRMEKRKISDKLQQESVKCWGQQLGEESLEKLINNCVTSQCPQNVFLVK